MHYYWTKSPNDTKPLLPNGVGDGILSSPNNNTNQIEMQHFNSCTSSALTVESPTISLDSKEIKTSPQSLPESSNHTPVSTSKPPSFTSKINNNTQQQQQTPELV